MSEQAFTSYRDFEPQGFHRGLLVAATHWIGAGLSVFLILGLVYWGYNLTMRDVTEVPVVRALEGPLRIQPEDPGGQIVAHQGMAVNTVQAEGGVEAPADRVVLAPAPVRLSDEDVAAAGIVPAPRNLMDVSTQSATDSQSDIDAAIRLAVAEASISPEVKNLAKLPGVKRSPRPRARVLVASLGTGATATAKSPSTSAIDVDPATITTGTRLIQLGAFDDRATAIKEWDAIVARHSDLVGARKRVIQVAESGGRKFYRLRMVGFSSLGASREVCSALLARGTPCIPVKAR